MHRGNNNREETIIKEITKKNSAHKASIAVIWRIVRSSIRQTGNNIERSRRINWYLKGDKVCILQTASGSIFHILTLRDEKIYGIFFMAEKSFAT